jgi:hypothetical protein
MLALTAFSGVGRLTNSSSHCHHQRPSEEKGPIRQIPKTTISRFISATKLSLASPSQICGRHFGPVNKNKGDIITFGTDRGIALEAQHTQQRSIGCLQILRNE